MKKQDVLELLRAMPEEIDLEQLLYTLYLKRKLELAEADFGAGRTVSHEEIEMEMAAWHD